MSLETPEQIAERVVTLAVGDLKPSGAPLKLALVNIMPFNYDIGRCRWSSCSRCSATDAKAGTFIWSRIRRTAAIRAVASAGQPQPAHTLA